MHDLTVGLKTTCPVFVPADLENRLQVIDLQAINPKRVGVRRLELPTSTSRTWRANQLCYTPKALAGHRHERDPAFLSAQR